MASFSRIYLGWLLDNGYICEPNRPAIPAEWDIQLVDRIPNQLSTPIDWVESCGILVSRNVFLVGITWETLRSQGLVYGRKVKLKGKDYLCRCPKLSNHGEWEQFLNATRHAVDWASGSKGFFGQEFIAGDGVFQMDRCSVAGIHAPQITNAQACDESNMNIGLRLVLEPIDPEPALTRDDIARSVSVYCGQFRLDGSLVDFSDYDLVIHYWKNTLMPTEFGPGINQDGEILCVDRQIIQHISLDPF